MSTYLSEIIQKITAIVFVSKTLLVLIYDEPFRLHFELSYGK